MWPIAVVLFYSTHIMCALVIYELSKYFVPATNLVFILLINVPFINQ